MWGTGARDSNTIPAALARLIASNPGRLRMRVVNMGESGYVNTQSLLALELELRGGNVPERCDLLRWRQRHLFRIPEQRGRPAAE